MPYTRQLEQKAKELEAILETTIEVVPSPDPYEYRNRMDFVCAFGKVGFRERGRFKEVVDLSECSLLPSRFLPLFLELKEAIKSLAIADFNYLNHKGYLRYMVFRVAKNTDDLMVSFVTASTDTAILPLLEIAAKKASSVHWLVHEGLADLSYGRSHEHRNNFFITETIGPLSYRMGPNTFFQNNALLMPALFGFIKKHAKGKVLDLYCGAGAISLFIADAVESVRGLEKEAESIALANENRKLNQVTNVEFECLDIAEWLKTGPDASQYQTLILDPPRSGLGGKVARKIGRLNIPRIIYVSCNPKSYRDDMVYLGLVYEVKEQKAFDMFPQTPHVEMVTLLERKQEVQDG